MGRIEELESRCLLTTPTVLSIARLNPSAAITSASSVTYGVTFNESVINVLANDFAVVKTGALASSNAVSVSGSGASYQVTVNGIHGNGTLGLNLIDNDTIHDAALNLLGGPGQHNGSFTGQKYTIQGQVFPQVLSITRLNPTSQFTDGASSVSFSVSFTKPVTGVAPADFQAVTTGQVNAGAVSVSGSGSSYNVTVSGVSGGGTLGLNLVDNGSIRDLIGNPLVQANATPSFSSYRSSPSGTGYAFNLVVGDLTGNGIQDVVVPDFYGDFTVLMGNGNGTLKSPQTYGSVGNLRNAAIADVNGDGKPDLILAHSAGVGVMLGNGDGTFQSEHLVSGIPASFVAVADLNGDGRPDIVSSYFNGSGFTVLLGNGDGSFKALSTVTDPYVTDGLVVANLTSDNIPDLVGYNRLGNEVGVYVGNGDGTFKRSQTFSTGFGSFPNGITVADIAGDGKPDIIVGNSGINRYGQDAYEPGVGIFVANGDGTFQNEQTFFAPAISGVTAADFTGDGKLDLAVSGSHFAGNIVSVVQGNGDGTFSPNQSNNKTDVNSEGVVVADMDGDGRPDLVVPADWYSGNFVDVLSNNATGSVTGPVYQVVPFVPGETNLQLNAPAQLAFGANGTVSVTITSPSGTPSGNVTLSVDNGTPVSKTLASGSASFTLSGLNAGSHTLDAEYAAQNGFLASSSLGSVVVSPIATTTGISAPSVPYGGSASVTVTVSAGAGIPTPAGSVTLTVNGTPLTAQTLTAQGTAVFIIPNATTSNLAASYSAQGNYGASSTNAVLTATSLATTASILAPSVTYGANGMVTVTISSGSGKPTPTGNVSLSVDGTSLGTQALVGQGTAVFIATGLAVGSHSLLANYAAQGYFLASSTSGTLTVNPATTTTSISAPSINAGGDATVTVSVAAALGLPNPSGSVSLTLEGSPQGSMPLSAQGSATFAISSPAAGSHALTATYSPGNPSNYAGSSGNGVLFVGSTNSSGDVTAGGLLFRPEGGTFAQSGNTYTATVPVAVGYAGGAFTALAILNGTTTIDSSALTVSSTGQVTSAIDGSGATLLNSLPQTAIASLVGSGVGGVTGPVFSVSGVPFTPSSLAFTNASGTPLIEMQGSLALPVGLTAPVNSSSYVTIGSSGIGLTGLNVAVNGTITVGGVGFTSANFTVQYNGVANAFTVTGTASAGISQIGNLTVSFGSSSSPGLVITNGSLTSLSVQVTSTFTVDEANFTANGLTLTYAAANQQYTLSGNASLAIGPSAAPICTVNVTFGTGTTPGIVITNGGLTSLNFTVSSTIVVKHVTFNAAGLWFTYSAAADQFELVSGSASVDINGVSTGGQAGQLDVTFGSGAAPGIVITNGSLTSLNATVNANFLVDGLTFYAGNLVFTYSSGTFTMNGSTGVTILGLANPLQVTFGYTDSSNVYHQGLVVTNGKLQNLNMIVNAMFKAGGVAIYADNLTFNYNVTAGNAVFSMSGSAEAAVGGIVSDLSNHIGVNFAQNTGLVVTNGSLTSLNMTVNGEFKVSQVTIHADSLNFTYTAANSQFAMSGIAEVTMKEVAVFQVSFGAPAAPGLVLNNGSLTSLNMTVFAGLRIPSIPHVTPEIDLTNLPNLADMTFTYTAATSVFTLTGSAGLIIPSAPGVPSWLTGLGVQVTFNGSGLVVTGGSLTSLDMTLNSNISFAGVGFQTQGMEFTYSAANGVFTLEGTGQFNDSFIGAVGVTFGGGTTKGLIITNGQLTNLDMTVNGNLGVGGVGFALSNTVMVYNGSTSTFKMTGQASMGIPYVGGVAVDFGGNGNTGLVITNGTLTAFNMSVGVGLSVGGFSFAATGLGVSYNSSTSTFTMSGGATFDFAGVAAISADFGGPGTQGLVITNGNLASLNMTVSANFQVGGVSVIGNLDMAYNHSANTFTMTGQATLEVFNVFAFTVTLGGPGTSGLVIQDGFVQSFNMTVSGSIGLDGLGASVNLTAAYDPTRQAYLFSGTASATFGSALPSWARTFLGSGTVSVNCDIYYADGFPALSFIDVYTTIAGDKIGVQVFFDGTVDILMGDPFSGIFQEIDYVASSAYTATAQSFVSAYETAAGGVTNAYNVTASQLQAAFNAASSGAQQIVSAIEDFFSSLGNLSGATVYYDANNDFNFASDPSAVTASDGSFQLSIPAGSSGGQYVVVGGTDLSTNLSNNVMLTAAQGSVVITPLTTLVNDVMQQTGLGAISANNTVDQALGISTNINVDTQEILKQALAGDASSAQAFAVEVQVSSMANQVIGLLSGIPGAPSDQTLSNAFFNSLAGEIIQATGPINLADAGQMQMLIEATASAAGVTPDGGAVSGAATIMAGINQYIEGLPVAGNVAYLNQVVQAQVVAEGTVAPQLAQVSAGTADIDSVVANNTGSALAVEIEAATAGTLDQDGPTLSITQTVFQPVGNGDPTTFQFTVYLTVNTTLSDPVTVNFTTVDGTATVADGDYTAASGTLTWAPGDTAPQTITVTVNPGSTIAADKQFQVVLQDAANATIQSGIGVGDIQFTDYATTTDLAPANTEVYLGQPVTLTATVTNEDPAADAGTGLVTFYNGATALGTAPLVDGVATLTVSDLPAGSYSITANYQGFQTPGAHYDTSISSAVSVVIDAAPQTITFAPLADHIYGDPSFQLSATSSSGLPVTFSIVWGSATLNGDILTITGAGSVGVEADQAGDSDYQAAPSVVQSFNVTPVDLLVVVDNQTMVYGGTLPTLTDSFSGFVNGDNASNLSALPALSTVPATSGVGSYNINANGAVDSNYNFIYVSGTLTITPAPLLITGGDQSVSYGSTSTLTADCIGLVNGDTPSSLAAPPTITTDATPGSPVGSYDIAVSGAFDPNYNIAYADGVLTVTPPPFPSTGVAGQPLTITLTPPFGESASALADGFTFNVNWGDGHTDNVVGEGGITDTHAYTGIGTFNVVVTATDDANVTSTVLSQATKISNALMEANGLAIAGTSAVQGVVLSSGAAANSIGVVRAGKSLGTFIPTNGNIIIYGDGGTDLVSINPVASSPDSYTLTGNTVTATLGSNTFSITLDNITNVALRGGTLANSFTDNGATVASTLYGGSGVNTYAFTGSTMGAATTIVGKGLNNSLAGPNLANIWTINGVNAGNLNGASWAFTGVQNLAGGTISDQFNFVGTGFMKGNIVGGIGGVILDYAGYTGNAKVNLQTSKVNGVAGAVTNLISAIGGAGTNTLVGANTSNIWSLTGVNAGTVDGLFTFSGFGNLTGGTSSDDFVFSPGAGVTGTILGGGGVNQLDYSAYGASIYVNLLTAAATATGGVKGISEVIGSGMNDVLVGNGPNVVLIENAGDNLIIGGTGGGATLDSGSGQDIVIAGSMTYDNNQAALLAIENYWSTNGGTFAQRSAALAAGVNGYVLNKTTVLHHFGAGDTINLGSANDWLFWRMIGGAADTLNGTPGKSNLI
jgi:hypothetical protein